MRLMLMLMSKKLGHSCVRPRHALCSPGACSNCSVSTRNRTKHRCVVYDSHALNRSLPGQVLLLRLLSHPVTSPARALVEMTETMCSLWPSLWQSQYEMTLLRIRVSRSFTPYKLDMDVLSFPQSSNVIHLAATCKARLHALLLCIMYNIRSVLFMRLDSQFRPLIPHPKPPSLSLFLLLLQHPSQQLPRWTLWHLSHKFNLRQPFIPHLLLLHKLQQSPSNIL